MEIEDDELCGLLLKGLHSNSFIHTRHQSNYIISLENTTVNFNFPEENSTICNIQLNNINYHITVCYMII